jgi:hypothetical protein
MLKRLKFATPKNFVDQFSLQKNKFYLKSIQIKTDYSRFTKYHRLYHPTYWDVERNRTQYQRDITDYKQLQFKTSDVLYYDHETPEKFKTTNNLAEIIDNMRKFDVFQGNTKFSFSPYKIINLMYNCVVKEGVDEYEDVFEKLEDMINLITIDIKELETRYIYGYLYAAYTHLDRVNLENLMYFENAMDEKCYSFKAEWCIGLMEVLLNVNNEASIKKFEDNMELIYEIIVNKFDKEVKYRQTSIIRLMDVLHRGKLYMCPDIWNLLIKRFSEKCVPMSIEDYDKVLRSFDWYYNEPMSFKYHDKELLDLITDLKNQNINDIDRSFVYNQEEMKWFTLNDMIAIREHKNEKTHHVKIPDMEEEENEQRLEEVKEEASEAEIRKDILEQLENGEHPDYIIDEVKQKYNDPNNLAEQILKEYQKSHRLSIVEKLKKDGQFDKLFQKKVVISAGSEGDKKPDEKGKGADDKKGKKKK